MVFGKNIGDRITFQIGDAKQILLKKEYTKGFGKYVFIGFSKSTINME